MAFRRKVAPPMAPSGERLTAQMAGIGMNFAVKPEPNPNIEDTLLFAAGEAMDRDDLRVLAMLVAWFFVHARWVNADRLTTLVAASGSPRVRALFSALASGLPRDRRFSRLARLYRGKRVDVVGQAAFFHIKRHGEDPRFED